MLVITADGVRSERPFEPQPRKNCVFEFVYFARPDSHFDGRSVYAARRQMGYTLASEAPKRVDVVIPVPDSGTPAAIGYAQALGIPLELGLIRSHYVGRTFIEPTSSIRNFGVRLKLFPVREVLEGKRVVAIDDSIVRGTTSRKIVTLLREAGAKEVHLRISSPPTSWPCYYGIDTPSRQELIASTKTNQEIADFVGADSLAYLSLEGLHQAVKALRPDHDSGNGYCDACFSGNYPVDISESERVSRLPVIRIA